MAQESQPQESQVDEVQPEADEEMRRKFREALDKKHAHGGPDVSDRSGRSKAAGKHGAETGGNQQMFRRKSGG